MVLVAMVLTAVCTWHSFPCSFANSEVHTIAETHLLGVCDESVGTLVVELSFEFLSIEPHVPTFCQPFVAQAIGNYHTNSL